MTSLLSDDEERYVSSPEGGDREMRHRPHSAPLSSVFGISEDSVFNMVQRGQSQSDIVLSSSWSRREKYRPVKIPTDTRFMMGIVELVMNLLNSRLAELMRSFSQGTLGPLSGSISASQQFAQEMLSMVSAKMYSHATEHIAHGQKSHPSKFLSDNRVVDLVLEVFGITGFLDSRSPSRPECLLLQLS